MDYARACELSAGACRKSHLLSVFHGRFLGGWGGGCGGLLIGLLLCDEGGRLTKVGTFLGDRIGRRL